jgi:hypothetical protein
VPYSYRDIEQRFTPTPVAQHQGPKMALIGRQSAGLAYAIHGLLPDSPHKRQALASLERCYRLVVREVRRS